MYPKQGSSQILSPDLHIRRVWAETFCMQPLNFIFRAFESLCSNWADNSAVQNIYSAEFATESFVHAAKFEGETYKRRKFRLWTSELFDFVGFYLPISESNFLEALGPRI